MAAQVPLQIGRYRIVGVVGAWEHGWVYRGRDDLLEREVWIKILPPNRRANDDTFVARFKDTIRRASGVPPVSSPNIVRVFECGSDAGLLYTVSEALEGRTLLETIEDGISLRVGLPIILQVLDGLAHLHETGIVHGDIQPANVFVCSDGCAKIMNFAHARFTDAASGAAESARSTDLLRVGAMLYEMVTGKQPDRPESIKILPTEIVSAEPGLSPVPSGPQWDRLRRVITRSLQKKPEDRYPAAGAMRADLELALKELGDSADWTPR
jgi:serine/threonine-protein kinase